ncbi:hypothetical protein [Afifella sp. IM 167]|uniref:hypothetical protein n=1 Tax=Afifella sp. IM 167 TaxID=2033586 RepID=UPI001CC9FA6A|nr:hypothetical protein [Afifella sp. IM 167]
MARDSRRFRARRHDRDQSDAIGEIVSDTRNFWLEKFQNGCADRTNRASLRHIRFYEFNMR